MNPLPSDEEIQRFAKWQHDQMRNMAYNAMPQNNVRTGCLFAIGDVVKLKSGGPLMTVASHPEPDGIISCDIAGVYPNLRFHQHTLKPASRWERFWKT